jgi:hypothetical protein
MGYYMNQADARFAIKKENEDRCLQAIKDLAGPTKDYSWVDNKAVSEAKSLAEAFDLWRWPIQADDEGEFAANYISFRGDKSGSEDVLFEAIAPFVEHGSYIQMDGEDGCVWRWWFVGGKCRETQPNWPMPATEAS